ncbi:S9 family peptidase [Streptomyces sp. MI02-7b]|uniref:S9 family peptidase n=1 Tax=Streptomyces sp. MI02-7b TaxID=462941 RepID=UPI0029A15277|nr:prolyl oligopeptidase family serine peptidase [Streptomyces sp. MI02-7b]MDX3071749.1 prolyl oligopeptidase family serine peptidase [Streptomyces sp. MI02-7b]
MTERTSTSLAELIVDSVAPRFPAISPDGCAVAYAASTIGVRERPASTLWLASADGSAPSRRLTEGTGRYGAPRWAPDSASLFFTAGGQLHRIPVGGGETETLTSWASGIAGQLPLADGRTVAVIAEDEPDAEDERREAEGDDAEVWGERVPFARLRLLDLGSGELRVVDQLGDRHVVHMAQRPDGGPLAVVSWSSPDIDPGLSTAELHVVDPVSGAVHDLGPAGPDASSPAWWAADDGWHLAYLTTTPPGTVGGSAVLDVAVPEAGPAAEHRNLTADTVVCPTELVQAADGPPLALFADGLDTALFRLDPRDLRFRRLFSRQGIVHALSVSGSGGTIAVMAGTAHEPKDVHAGSPEGALARVSDTRPQLRDVVWGSQERLSYKASDGLALDGLLLLPPGRSREDGPFPLITIVHGGPYGRYADEFQFHIDLPPGQWFAAAGYAVFLPNPRGGEGHGHPFAAMAAGAAGGAEWTDITEGIDLLIAEGVADPDRLGIGGWSHGGYMAAWAVGQTDRFKAAVMGAGVSDWGMLAATGEWGPANEAGVSGSVGWEGPGPHPHDRVSPISYASRIRTPVLILHGEHDTNVPIGQAVLFHRALRHFGVEHEFVTYPREGHMIGERGHLLDLLRRTRAWFDRRLGSPGAGSPGQDGRPVDGQGKPA